MFVAPTEKAIKRALRLRERIEATPVLDARDAEEKARLQCEAEDAMALVRLGADLLVAAALDPEPRRREPLRERFLAEFQVALAADEEMLSLTELGKQPAREALAELRADAENLLGVNRPFHWPLEFPEIFIALAEQGEPPGFSAVVGKSAVVGRAMQISWRTSSFVGPTLSVWVGNLDYLPQIP
jgi:hypothetical protein